MRGYFKLINKLLKEFTKDKIKNFIINNKDELNKMRSINQIIKSIKNEGIINNNKNIIRKYYYMNGNGIKSSILEIEIIKL